MQRTKFELQQAEKKLEVFQRQQKAVIERLSAEVDRLWKAGGRAGNPVYEQAYWKLEEAKRVEREYAEKYTRERDVIRAALAKQEAEAERQAIQRAEQVEKAEREKARAAWLSSGGDPRRFEASWPGIYQRMVEDKTLAALKADEQPLQAVEY